MGLFLDLRKAFDSINHKILLNKLSRYGIRGVANKLIESYLSTRQQLVRLGETNSSMLTIERGVPQGSKLGPLLFFTYINDITSIPQSPELIMYADDTNAFFTSKDVIDLSKNVNQYLATLSLWLRQNELQLNSAKTKYVIFHPINKPIKTDLTVRFEGTTIARTREQKFLGVWFNENLNWNTHITQLSNELARTVGMLYRIAHIVPLWLKMQLYNTLFYSKLCYGALVWGTTTNQNYKKLITLQKRMLRIYINYTGCISNLRTAPLFCKHSMLRADQIYYFKLLQNIYRNKEKLTDSEPNITHYCFRHSNRHTPKTRTNYGKQELSYQTVIVLNKLSDQIDFNVSIGKFTKQLRDLVLTQNIRYS